MLLMERVRAGDQDAATLLVSRHEAAIQRADSVSIDRPTDAIIPQLNGYLSVGDG